VRRIHRKPDCRRAAAGSSPWGSGRPARRAGKTIPARLEAGLGLRGYPGGAVGEDGPDLHPQAPARTCIAPGTATGGQPAPHSHGRSAGRTFHLACFPRSKPAARPDAGEHEAAASSARIAGLALCARFCQNSTSREKVLKALPRKTGGDRSPACSWPSGRPAAPGRPAKPGRRRAPRFTPKGAQCRPGQQNRRRKMGLTSAANRSQAPGNSCECHQKGAMAQVKESGMCHSGQPAAAGFGPTGGWKLEPAASGSTRGCPPGAAAPHGSFDLPRARWVRNRGGSGWGAQRSDSGSAAKRGSLLHRRRPQLRTSRRSPPRPARCWEPDQGPSPSTHGRTPIQSDGEAGEIRSRRCGPRMNFPAAGHPCHPSGCEERYRLSGSIFNL